MITIETPIRFADPVPEETDVVVIGGGIAGLATTYFLAMRGARVFVCEKGRVGGEQSSRNWGWVRQQGRDRAELPIMMEANRIWSALATECSDADLEFTQSGCLYLADTPAKLATYEAWYETARDHQIDTKLLSAGEIAERYPDVAGNWLGGMLTETDGRAEPVLAIPALARAAQRAGAGLAEACAVRCLDMEGGRVRGVVTEKGRIRCAKVLLAGGVWSTYFAANLGLALPQLAVRSTVARTAPGRPIELPNISAPDLAMRPRRDGGCTVAIGTLVDHDLTPGSFRYLPKFFKVLKTTAKDVRLGLAAPKDFPGAWGMARRWSADRVSPFEKMRVVDPAPSARVVRRIEQRLPQRVPALREAKIAESWAGLIDVTPDVLPVLDKVEQAPGLYLATGLSGHGFGLGPAIGRVMADLMMDKPTGYDLTRFRLSRFFDGSPIVPGPF